MIVKKKMLYFNYPFSNYVEIRLNIRKIREILITVTDNIDEEVGIASRTLNQREQWP